jgi:hypothetical protein
MGNAAKWDVITALDPRNRGVANATTANSSGATIDLQGYVHPGGRQLRAFLHLGVVTSTGNLSVKMQDSSTTAEAGFADITGAVFPSTGDNASTTGSSSILFRTNNRYVRALGQAANTAQLTYGVVVMAEKRRA